MERERGPIEQRLQDLMVQKASGTPWMLEAHVEGGRGLSPVEHINQLHFMSLVLMEALLELAREVDDLRASL